MDEITCPAAPEDVAARWTGHLTDEDKKRVQVWLEDAWLQVKKVPALTERVHAERAPHLPVLRAGDLERETITVLCSMVIRVLKNPKSLWQFSVDDGSAQMDRTISSGELYLSPDEYARLAPRAGNALAGMYSIPMGIPYWGA